MGYTANHGYFETPLPVTATDAEKISANLITADNFAISSATLDHEIARLDLNYNDTGDGKPSLVAVQWFKWDTFKQVKASLYGSEGGPPITEIHDWIAHKADSEISAPGEYRVLIQSNFDSNAWSLSVYIVEGEPPPAEIDLVFSRTSAAPDSFTMPAEVTFTTPLLNNGDETVYFDFNLFRVNPGGGTTLMATLENESLAAHSTWNIESVVNFTDLPEGSYGTLVKASEPGIFNIYAERTDTDVFSVSAEAPPTGTGLTFYEIGISNPYLTMPQNATITIKYHNFDEAITGDFNVFVKNQSTSSGWHILYPKSVSFPLGNYQTLSYDKSFSQLTPGIYDVWVSVDFPSNGVPVDDYTSVGLFEVTDPVSPDPEFTVTNLSVTPTSTEMPAEMTFKADIENIGSESVDYVVAWDLIAPDSSESSISVSSDLTLPAGQIVYAEATHQYTNLTDGIYSFRVSAIQLGTGVICNETTLNNAFTITTEAPAFWETFLDIIGVNNLIDVLLGLTQTAFNGLNTIFKVMTGEDFVESDAEVIKDYLPGFVAWSVIEYGKMLNDEAREIPTETEMIYITALAAVIAAVPLAWEAIGAKIATGPATGSAEAYLSKYFLTVTAESAPAAGTLEAIILANSANAGVVATAASTSTLTTLTTIFGETITLSSMLKIAALIAGADSIAVWLASDNIVTGTTFPMNRLKEMVEAGTVTKEEALEEISTIQQWKDYATNFISVSGIVNPLMWLFRSLFMKNTELAQTNIDQIKTQIEATGPTPAETGTLIVSSDPPGARIYIDNEFKYEYTDTDFLVPIGDHTVTLKIQDYADYSGSINIIQDITTSFSAVLTAIIPKMRLTVWSTPPNARVYIDDVFKYEYTNTTFSAPAGYHKLTLKKESYNDYTANYDYPEGSERAVEFDLAAGDGQITYPISEVEFELTPTVRTYNCWKVNISAKNIYSGEALNAWVLIDDIYQSGTTPLDVFLVAQSTYDIKLHLAGYREAQQIFTTEALP